VRFKGLFKTDSQVRIAAVPKVIVYIVLIHSLLF
jgi:hypothetical protein